MAFLLVAGHPALDLVNTLDWRFRASGAEELLKTYDDLVRFSEQSKVLKIRPSGAGSAGARALARCKELREALAEIFYARLDGRKPSTAARNTLERYFQEARLKQKLNWKQSPRLEWGWSGMERDPELPVWALAMSASHLMTSEAVPRVRACDNTECRWLFLDTSKNHTRRWCDMKVCGNRMKARRFKAQKTPPLSDLTGV
jgi:predicted RNA-binding Zn ribbon-like protein